MLKIEFDTDNAAYRDGDDVDGRAVADSLRTIANVIAEGFTAGPVIDTNGAHVGHWTLDASA